MPSFGATFVLRKDRIMTAKIERTDVPEAARPGAPMSNTRLKPSWLLATFAAFAVVMGLTFTAAAQTATSTTGVVVGVVTDATGAVLPGVSVVLTDVNTNAPRETVTSESGHYSFANVLPGKYKLSATLQGFQQTIVPEIVVEVNKSNSVDVKLGVGQVSEAVEVTGSAAVALQHNDSTVTNTMSEQTVLRLPNPTRSIESIQFNQPLTIPYSGGVDSSRSRAGSVAGARTDQNTYTLDGADVSDNVVGDGFLETLPSAIVPLPAESVEEFSAATTNANATFGRGSGAQFVVVTKRGTNRFRGSGYFYRQDDAFNANTWNRNRLSQAKPELEDNRGGFSLGGPIQSNKMFFFTNYEARRFPRTTVVNRTVPTDSLKAGLLLFRDAAGNVNTYNMRTLDPRGIGLNPVVASFYDLLPGGQRHGWRRRSQHDPVHGRSRFIVQQRHLRAAPGSQRLDELARGCELPVRQHPRARCGTGGHQRFAAGQCEGPAGCARRPAARAAVPRRRSHRPAFTAAPQRNTRVVRARLPGVHPRGSLPAGTGHQRGDGRWRRGRADWRKHQRRTFPGRQSAHVSGDQQLDLEPRQAHHPLRRHLAARVPGTSIAPTS